MLLINPGCFGAVKTSVFTVSRLDVACLIGVGFGFRFNTSILELGVTFTLTGAGAYADIGIF